MCLESSRAAGHFLTRMEGGGKQPAGTSSAASHPGVRKWGLKAAPTLPADVFPQAPQASSTWPAPLAKAVQPGGGVECCPLQKPPAAAASVVARSRPQLESRLLVLMETLQGLTRENKRHLKTIHELRERIATQAGLQLPKQLCEHVAVRVSAALVEVDKFQRVQAAMAAQVTQRDEVIRELQARLVMMQEERGSAERRAGEWEAKAASQERQASAYAEEIVEAREMEREMCAAISAEYGSAEWTAAMTALQHRLQQVVERCQKGSRRPAEQDLLACHGLSTPDLHQPADIRQDSPCGQPLDSPSADLRAQGSLTRGLSPVSGGSGKEGRGGSAGDDGVAGKDGSTRGGLGGPRVSAGGGDCGDRSSPSYLAGGQDQMIAVGPRAVPWMPGGSFGGGADSAATGMEAAAVPFGGFDLSTVRSPALHVPAAPSSPLHVSTAPSQALVLSVVPPSEILPAPAVSCEPAGSTPVTASCTALKPKLETCNALKARGEKFNAAVTTGLEDPGSMTLAPPRVEVVAPGCTLGVRTGRAVTSSAPEVGPLQESRPWFGEGEEAQGDVQESISGGPPRNPRDSSSVIEWLHGRLLAAQVASAQGDGEGVDRLALHGGVGQGTEERAEVVVPQQQLGDGRPLGLQVAGEGGGNVGASTQGVACGSSGCEEQGVAETRGEAARARMESGGPFGGAEVGGGERSSGLEVMVEVDGGAKGGVVGGSGGEGCVMGGWGKRGKPWGAAKGRRALAALGAAQAVESATQAATSELPGGSCSPPGEARGVIVESMGCARDGGGVSEPPIVVKAVRPVSKSPGVAPAEVLHGILDKVAPGGGARGKRKCPICSGMLSAAAADCTHCGHLARPSKWNRRCILKSSSGGPGGLDLDNSLAANRDHVRGVGIVECAQRLSSFSTWTPSASLARPISNAGAS